MSGLSTEIALEHPQDDDFSRVDEHPGLGLALRLLAMALLSIMLLLVKITGQHGISILETIFWRQGISVCLILPFVMACGQLQKLRTTRITTHARRALAGLVGMVLIVASVRLLPLAESTVLGFTAPMFAVALAAVILKEPIGWVRWSAVALGLVGVIVIVSPDGHASISSFGIAVGLAAAFMVALTSIQLRDLGKTEAPLTVVFWYALFSAPVAGITLLWVNVSHSALDWLCLVGIGICGFAGQMCLTASLQHAKVVSVIVMDYSSLGWATLWGWLVFDSIPSTATWIGGPLIVGAGLIIVWRENRAARSRKFRLRAIAGPKLPIPPIEVRGSSAHAGDVRDQPKR